MTLNIEVVTDSHSSIATCYETMHQGVGKTEDEAITDLTKNLVAHFPLTANIRRINIHEIVRKTL